MYCNICRSKNIRDYKVVDDVSIYQCLNCEAAFVDSKTLRKKTNDIYSFPDYQRREGQFVKRYEHTLELLKKYTNGKHILEVGAGFGLLSSMLYKEGYKIDALEPNVEAKYLRGLSVGVFKTYFADYARHTKETYDAIILYDVFEHVDFPKETVLLLESLLNDKGIVLIQTPNYQSFMARIVRNWSWWMVADHRYYFSRKSFDLLFDKTKWNELFYSSYEDWIDLKKNLDGNFHDKFSKLVFLIWFIPLYFLFRRLLWKAGFGGLHLTIWRYNKG